ncbi:MAG: hydrogenase maturation protease [bacterium]
MEKLILGFGNDILADDGIGLYLARDIGEKLGIDWVHCSIYGFEIIEKMAGYSTIFIIDSVVEPDDPPGKIYSYALDDFKNCRHLSSPHTTNFSAGIEFARRSGLPVPADFFIYGVNVIETSRFSENLSLKLQRLYPEAKEKLQDKIKQIIRD